MEIEKLKGLLNKQREEYQRYLGIMREDFNSKLQLIGEQYHTITEMIGSLAEDLQIIKTDVEFLASGEAQSPPLRAVFSAIRNG